MDRRALFGLAAVALAAAPARAAPSGGSSAPADAYVPLATLTATIVRNDGRRGVMSVEAGVDVADAALRERAVLSVPRLRAALSAIIQRTGAGLLPGHPPDIDRLSRELQAAADQVLGRAGARVLLGTVMVS